MVVVAAVVMAEALALLPRRAAWQARSTSTRRLQGRAPAAIAAAAAPAPAISTTVSGSLVPLGRVRPRPGELALAAEEATVTAQPHHQRAGRGGSTSGRLGRREEKEAVVFRFWRLQRWTRRPRRLSSRKK